MCVLIGVPFLLPFISSFLSSFWTVLMCLSNGSELYLCSRNRCLRSLQWYSKVLWCCTDSFDSYCLNVWLFFEFLLFLQPYVQSVFLVIVLVFLFLLVAHLLSVCVDRYFWCLRFITFLKEYSVVYCIGCLGLVNEVFPVRLGCCCGCFCRFYLFLLLVKC